MLKLHFGAKHFWLDLEEEFMEGVGGVALSLPFSFLSSLFIPKLFSKDLGSLMSKICHRIGHSTKMGIG